MKFIPLITAEPFKVIGYLIDDDILQNVITHSDKTAIGNEDQSQ